VSNMSASLRVGVFTVSLLSIEQEEEIDVGVSACVEFLRRFLKICRLVQRLESALAVLHFNTLTSGHVERRDCSPMRC
jgi:hypothetical protein